MVDQLNIALWDQGPTFAHLLDTFVISCTTAAHFDVWLPMRSEKTHPIVAWFFQGAALRLADSLVVHPKVATVALMFASINYIFPHCDSAATSELILGLSTPKLDGEDQIYSFHFQGANAVDEWLQAGIDTTPPTHQILSLVEVINIHAVNDVRNPDGLADVVANTLDRLTILAPRPGTES